MTTQELGHTAVAGRWRVGQPTPGPWIAHPHRSDMFFIHSVSDKLAHRIATISVVGGVRSKHEADARLIAASPELLEALRRVHDWLASVVDADFDEVVADGGITAGMVIGREARDQQSRVRAAIAKATGHD